MNDCRVCHLTSVHPPYDTRIYHKECKTLSDAGYSVVLVVCSGPVGSEDGIEIVTLPAPGNRFSRIFLAGWRVCRAAAKQKAEIYHFHDPELLPLMRLLKKITGAKVVYDVHEDVPGQIMSKEWIPAPFRKLVSKGVGFLEDKASSAFDAVVTATPRISMNFPRLKAVEIQNYPVLDYFDRKPLSSGSSRKGGEEFFKLLYAGGITRIRGLEEIFESLQLVGGGGVRLALLGRFEDAAFENRARELPGWRRVDFKGWLPLDQTYREMEDSDAGVICFLPHPNHVEAVPNKLFEYMASGIPVIASNFPGWRGVIEKHKCGICVDPRVPAEIAGAVDYLATHPEEAKLMGENGRRAVFDFYNWEVEKEKLLELYRRLRKK